MDPEGRLIQDGIVLPAPNPAVANYVMAARSGHLLFLAGHGSFVDGKPVHTGRLGEDLTVEQGRTAADLSTVVCRFDAPQEGRAAASRFDVADAFQLWWDARSDPRQGTLLPSYVDLSERFYEEVLGHPVPVDLRAIELLKGSPLRLDIYTWLTYRFSYLRRTTAIPWELLRLQFGSHLADSRQGRHQFKRNFTDHLARVLVVYRDAKVEVTDAGLVLSPSPPHVRARRLRPGISS